MATRPDPSPDAVPAPDIIEPQSPDELPVTEPDEIVPVGPDYDQPDSAPMEVPPD